VSFVVRKLHFSLDRTKKTLKQGYGETFHKRQESLLGGANPKSKSEASSRTTPNPRTETTIMGCHGRDRPPEVKVQF